MNFEDVIFTAKIDLTPTIPLNVYLVKGANYAVWIDSGIKSMFPQFVEVMGRAGVRPADLRFVLHTHSHHDHIGCNAQLKHHTGCLLAAPGYYAAWHSDFEAHLIGFARQFPDLIPDTPDLRDEALGPMDAPRPLDLHTDEGAFFDLGGGVTLRAFSLPGHLMAEVGWFESGTKTLILGDAITGIAWPLFQGHVTVKGYRHSLEKIRRLLPELGVQRVICAHYPAMTPDQAHALTREADTYINDIETNLIRQIAAADARGLPLETLWRTLCVQMDKRLEFRSLHMTAAHLDDLAERSLIHQIGVHTYALK